MRQLAENTSRRDARVLELEWERGVGKRQPEQEDEFGVLVRDWITMAQGTSVFSSMNWGELTKPKQTDNRFPTGEYL